MSLHFVGALPLGGINLAAAGATGALAPTLAQLDAMLFGQFGLGALQAEVATNLSAALQAQIQISFQIGNPLLSAAAQIAAAESVLASLIAGLELPNLGLAFSLSSSAAISATQALKLGGIQALITAVIGVKLPAVDFLANLAANLSAGPVVVASWGYASSPVTLAATGADIQAAFAAGIGGILPGEVVYGVLLTTKVASASTALSATLLVV